MSANEAYQYRFDGKLYHHNQAEIVAFDVENVVLIAILSTLLNVRFISAKQVHSALFVF